MISILIVDDDYRDRQGMSTIINRQKWPVKTFEAKCGQTALGILSSEDIDILITDIRMPDMLGTDLAKQAIELHPKLKMVFISAYKDFEYAQQALRFGAVNYLLKPYLIQDFISAIDEVVKICISENEKENGEASANLPADQLSRDRLITCLLENRDDASLLSELSAIVGDISGGIQPVILECLGSKKYINHLPLKKIFFDIFKTDFPFFCLNRRRCLILLSDPERFLPSTKLSDTLIDNFKDIIDTEVCIVYGKVVHAPGEIFSQYDLMLETLEICFFTDSSIVLEAGSNDMMEYESNLQISSLTDRIAFKIHSKDYESSLDDIRFLFDYFKRSNHLSAIYVKYISSNIINRIFQNINIENIETHMQKRLEKIFDLQSVYDIYSVFEELIAEIRDTDEQNNNSQLINNIYYLVETQYMKDLTLETIASQLYISSSYLSHLFKRETGQNFIDYVKNYRLKKSCELLKNTNLRISQICNKIGYESTSYYCSLFKNTYGITPTQYRKRSYKKTI